MQNAPGRPRRLSPEQEREIWERRKRGESINAIATALLTPSGIVHVAVARRGGVAPAPRTRAARALTLAVNRYRRAAG